MTDTPSAPELGSALVTTPQDRSLELIVRPQGKRSASVRYADFETFAPHIQLEAVAFDALGWLWGAGAGGVMRWEQLKPTEVAFTTWHSEHGLAGNDVTHLDAGRAGIVVGHASGYVSVYREDDAQWDVYTHSAGYPVRALGVDEAGTILAATDAGLFDVLTGATLNAPDEPVLCAAFALGGLWLGTAGGLWRSDAHDVWKVYDGSAVTQLQPTSAGLWIGGTGGLAFTPDGQKVIPAKLTTPVLHLDAADDTLYVVTASEIMRIRIHGGESLLKLAEAIRLFAAGETSCVYGDAWQLQQRTHEGSAGVKPLPLLPNPDVDKTPRNPARIFPGGLVQDDDNSLWLQAGSEWKLIQGAVKTGAVTAIWGAWVAAQYGLAQFIDHSLMGKTLMPAATSLGEIVALVEFDGAWWAVALENARARDMSYAVWQCDDGQAWRRVVRLPASLGVPLALVTDAALQLVTTGGLYNLPDLELVSPLRTLVSVVSESGARVAVSDGRRVWAAGGVEIPLPRDCAAVTALAFVGDTLYVGTVSGLWRMSHLPERFDARTSGLAHDTVAALHADEQDAVLWVQTAGGMTKMIVAR